MNHAPSLVRLRDVTRVDALVQSPGGWLPARPMGLFSLKSRVKLAWMVFTGRADAYVWPQDEDSVKGETTC